MNEENKSTGNFPGNISKGTLNVHRLAFKMKLHKGKEAEYKKRHDELWPDLQLLLKETGVSDYSIFLEEASGNLFAVLKVQDPLLLDELPLHPVMQKWWAYMKDIWIPIQTTPRLVFLCKKFFI